MEIECKNNIFGMPMEHVKVGECFLLNDELHMKISKEGNTKVEYSSLFPNVVINLKDNKLNSVANDVIVNKVNAKIVVG